MRKSAIAPAFLVASISLTQFTLAAQRKPATLQLPAPDGCHLVGTRMIVLSDSSRKRDLIVTLWYPSKRGSTAAPYMDNKTALALAAEWKLQAGFAERVHTSGTIAASINENAPFPLVLLEHGSGVVPAVYTVLAEGLASHGFIVAATNHPPDWPLEADRRTQGVAIARFAEDVLVRDVRFVLDQMQEMSSAAVPFTPRLPRYTACLALARGFVNACETNTCSEPFTKSVLL